jgi:hypothetical protein
MEQTSVVAERDKLKLVVHRIICERKIAVTENNEPIFADTPEATERRTFAPAEMVACPACSRSNAPTRENCLYCGAALPITKKNVPLPTAPSPESPSEKSFHVVAVPSEHFQVDETVVAEAASLLELTRNELNPLLGAKIAAPLCSKTTLAEVESVRERLHAVGIETVSIEDEQLNPDTTPNDLRGLELRGDSLTAVYRRASERVAASWEDISLIVVGRLHMITVEVEQKRNRKSSQVLNERELSTDEAVLDLYARNEPAGWRIRSGSFDFSCLGKDKAITAFENFAKLSGLLRERAVNARVDDSYNRLRSALNKVWPIEPGGDTTERRRSAKGRIEARITSSDNEAQFTRYSRMLQLIGNRQADGNE